MVLLLLLFHDDDFVDFETNVDKFDLIVYYLCFVKKYL